MRCLICSYPVSSSSPGIEWWSILDCAAACGGRCLCPASWHAAPQMSGWSAGISEGSRPPDPNCWPDHHKHTKYNSIVTLQSLHPQCRSTTKETVCVTYIGCFLYKSLLSVQNVFDTPHKLQRARVIRALQNIGSSKSHHRAYELNSSEEPIFWNKTCDWPQLSIIKIRFQMEKQINGIWTDSVNSQRAFEATSSSSFRII